MTSEKELKEIIKQETKRIMEERNLEQEEDINEGFCTNLAHSVSKRTDTDVDYMSTSVHCWLRWNGKHFDSERPEGVERPQELPTFKRSNITEVPRIIERYAEKIEFNGEKCIVEMPNVREKNMIVLRKSYI